jgi:2-polyprenyl-6-methoxyphenol hydroxylase-like FAD-dependent oxidoreductase
VHVPQEAEELLKEVGASDRLPEERAPSRLKAFPGRPGHVRRPWGAGWALAGDAGHYLDPLSTHGMTDAMRDAELLAQSADEVLAGEDEAAALAAYETGRDRIAGPMFATVDQIAGYRWTVTGVRRLLLEQSAAMAHEVEFLSALGA